MAGIVVQDGSALQPVCLVWPGGVPGAAQAAAHPGAAVRHRLHLQPCLCNPGSGADSGRHPQGHFLHAEVIPAEFLAQHAL